MKPEWETLLQERVPVSAEPYDVDVSVLVGSPSGPFVMVGSNGMGADFRVHPSRIRGLADLFAKAAMAEEHRVSGTVACDNLC